MKNKKIKLTQNKNTTKKSKNLFLYVLKPSRINQLVLIIFFFLSNNNTNYNYYNNNNNTTNNTKVHILISIFVQVSNLYYRNIGSNKYDFYGFTYLKLIKFYILLIYHVMQFGFNMSLISLM